MMNILFIGEIVGKKGLDTVTRILPELIKSEKLDFVVANGNKIDKGFAIIEPQADQLCSQGVDVITLGDNCFKKKATVEYLESANSVIRPINTFYNNPGKGYKICRTEAGVEVCVISAFGRTNFRNPVLDNPFMAVNRVIKHLDESIKVILLDFHANATSEKLCMGFYMSGKVSAVIGTSFSVQTSDLGIDDYGTAYISDIGMVGAKYSVCGYKPEGMIQSYLTGLFPRKQVDESQYIFNSIKIEVDPENGEALSAKCINLED